jgi:dGTPase
VNAWLEAPWSDRRSGATGAREGDSRLWFERDCGRIIHSGAFRRLQTKTQVLGMGGSDFHRTRLTHSLETAQIAQGIVACLEHSPETPPEARAVLPPKRLIEAIALAHDLGHPPFGHGGEIALNWCMRDHGGFEGNGQTLRLLSRLEAHSGEFGLDLARRTLLGVLKYPVPASAFPRPSGSAPPMQASLWRPPKCHFAEEADIVDWILAPLPEPARDRLRETRPGGPDGRALDTSLLEIADDIAYGVHDLEDAIVLRLLAQDPFLCCWQRHRASLAALRAAPPDAAMQALFADDSSRKRAIGALVNFFIVQVTLAEAHAPRPALLAWTGKLPPPAAAFLSDLIALVRRHVIERPVVQMLEYRGQEIVRRLFETLASDPARFLPDGARRKWVAAAGTGAAWRIICDTVAAMTDEQATRTYELLFAPRTSPSFGML